MLILFHLHSWLNQKSPDACCQGYNEIIMLHLLVIDHTCSAGGYSVIEASQWLVVNPTLRTRTASASETQDSPSSR